NCPRRNNALIAGKPLPLDPSLRSRHRLVSMRRRGCMSAHPRDWGVAVVVAFTMMAAAEARAADIFEQNFWLSGPRYDAGVPLCEEPGALGKIQARFAEKEGRFWSSDLQIVASEKVREIAFRPWAEGTIPRRFCTATALV